MQSFDVLATDVLKIQLRNIRDAHVVVIVTVPVGPLLCTQCTVIQPRSLPSQFLGYGLMLKVHVFHLQYQVKVYMAHRTVNTDGSPVLIEISGVEDPLDKLPKDRQIVLGSPSVAWDHW